MGRPWTSGGSGRRETAATANPARTSPERGEPAAGGTRRGNETDRLTHVRGTTLRVRVHAATLEYRRGVASYVRESAYARSRTRSHVEHTHVRDGAACT